MSTKGISIKSIKTGIILDNMLEFSSVVKKLNRKSVLLNSLKKSFISKEISNEKAELSFSSEQSISEGSGLSKDIEVTQPNKEDLTSESSLEFEWIAETLNGDIDSFKNLFDKYYSRVKSIAFGILSNEQDAEDVTQEAFLKAYKNLSSFKGQSSFYTWIYRIVYNLCIDTKRKSSRKNELPTSDSFIFEKNSDYPLADNFLSSQFSPERNAYRLQLAKIIKDAMSELSPSHRAVIMLREVEGLSYEDISESLGCSLGTVMSRLFHARKKLASSISDALKDRGVDLDIQQEVSKSQDY